MEPSLSPREQAPIEGNASGAPTQEPGATLPSAGRLARRSFLLRVGAAVTGGLLLASCEGPGDEAPREGTAPGADADWGGGGHDWERVRTSFSLSPDRVHLGALLLASHPRPVREAIARYRQQLDADPVETVERENDRRQQEVRDAAAEYVGARAAEIALTDSTTEGIALVYHGLPLQPGDEVLTTEHAYYATWEALRQVSERTGATMRSIRLHERPEDASTDEIVGRLAEAITPSTRALALTWVHSSTGVKLPLSEIGRVVAEVNSGRGEADRILVCVDGVHGLGVEDVNVTDLGCDFIMAGCHKWIFGPRGTGIVWGRDDAWTRLRPTIPTFMEQESWDAWARGEPPQGPTNAARVSPGGFKPFEHQWALAEAFRFHQEIGSARVTTRTHALNQRLKEGLAEMNHVRLRTPMEAKLSSGIVCFEVEGLGAEQVVEQLREKGIISTATPYARSYPRFTASIYNTPEDVRQALREVEALA